ncbi:MAG: hypothetical protein XU15_C0011G0099 [candidate division NC10 bacterium CSP1-5]|nr:MAG: hypothetical protein XU15_C0011G0099 [candidate division NC10 bacterium CSP1-5]
MNCVINFSHPLTEYQYKDLSEQLGHFTEVYKPVQFDMVTGNLRREVETLLNDTVQDISEIVAIIPPKLSVAAYWMALEMEALGWHNVPAVYFIHDSSVPPQFVVGGVE